MEVDYATVYDEAITTGHQDTGTTTGRLMVTLISTPTCQYHRPMRPTTTRPAICHPHTTLATHPFTTDRNYYEHYSLNLYLYPPLCYPYLLVCKCTSRTF